MLEDEFYPRRPKSDKGKLDWTVLPWRGLRAVAEIMTAAKEKYPDRGWEQVDLQTYLRATLRHLMAHLGGTRYDLESGKLHLAHAAANLLIVVEKTYDFR